MGRANPNNCKSLIYVFIKSLQVWVAAETSDLVQLHDKIGNIWTIIPATVTKILP